ncbi:hypothetical protein OIHEL45_18976 [Sulfitobacter indolifex HEL-45]|uniref:Uncharacterized protein n=2 Tax=Sulfitobacter indolifex TaxID=225422 RepID=A0ABP2D487_9RHOB|nr:hypothetical protein OIHEL45_18976 [Sulfitobacter indolifex HEL-45]
MGSGMMIGGAIFALSGQFAALVGHSSRIILSGHTLQTTIKINLRFLSPEARPSISAQKNA